MRTVVRIMAVTVLITAALSLDAVHAAKPPAGGRQLCFELADGTVITGRIDAKVITIRISKGNVLKIPVADLTELTVGLNDRAKPQSKIQAGKSTLVGTVTVKQFRIDSPYGRITVKLDKVHRVRPAEAGIVSTAPNKLERLIVELRDKTRLKGIPISQALRVQTRCGTMVVPFAQIQKAIFAPDGKSIRVLCWGSDRIVGALGASATISLKTDKGRVDLPAGKIAVAAYGPLTLKEHSAPMFSVAFSPDGKRLASGGGHFFGGSNRTIKIWDTVTGKELLTLKGHPRRVQSVAFSPDGKRLASGSFDRTIKLWDTADGKELLTLKGHSGWVPSVAFSPDGKRLASGGGDSPSRPTASVWPREAATPSGSGTLSQERNCSRSRGIQTRCGPSPSHLMASVWPREAGTRPSSYGILSQEPNSSLSRDIQKECFPSPSRLMANAWPLETTTGPSSSGTPSRERNCLCSGGIQKGCLPSPSHPMASAWPRQARTRPSSYGMSSTGPSLQSRSK